MPRLDFVRAALASALLLIGASAYADVRISMTDGRVTVLATDATLRQILEEWARVGDTTFVNIDRVRGGAMTIQLTDVAEQDALDALPRAMGEYVAAERATPVAHRSVFSRLPLVPPAAAADSSAAARLQAPALPERVATPE